MLHLLPERLSIELSPQACRIRRKTRWGKNSTTNEILVSAVSNHQSSNWQPAIEALTKFFLERKSVRSEVEITLSDRFARYVIIPWSDALRNAREVDALAKARFEEVFGDSVQRWEMKGDMRVYGCDGLACAIDVDLVQQLKAIAFDRKWKINSLTTHFVRVVNRHRKQIPANAIIATGMDDSWALMCRVGGHWRSSRVIARDAFGTSVRARMEQELLWLGICEDVPMLVVADVVQQRLLNCDDGVTNLCAQLRSNQEAS